MKKLLYALLLSMGSLAAQAQDTISQGQQQPRRVDHGFKKENLFTGGNVNISFFNGATVLGGTPHFGYSLTNWLDAAVSFNYSYISQRYDNGDKQRQNILAPGLFLRAYPLNFLFVHAQYEHSFITRKYITYPTGATDRIKNQANSLLLGPGYCSGREGSGSSFYYFSVLFDVLKQPGSPYIDNRFNDVIPFISAGFNIALFQGRGGSRYRD
jgi:hypothetical protein